MADDCRNPSIIQEEISDLETLIQKKEKLISKYPDKYSLKVGYQSLKDREDHLLLELKSSYGRHQMDTFDFVLDGNVVDKHSISLSFFGEFVSYLQDAVTSIAQSLIDKPTVKGAIPKEILDASRLDLVATTAGSFRFVLSSHQPQLGESIAKRALQQFSNLTDCEDDKDKIKNMAENLGIRAIKKYQKFLEVLYKNNANVKMYDKIVPEGFHTKEITSDMAERIYYVISEVAELPAESVTYYGKLTGVNIRSYTFEFVVDDSNEIIKGTFGDSLTEDTKKRLDTNTTIKFDVSTAFEDVFNEEKKEWQIVGFMD
ncbi:MAG TPA: hypothetical protein C5S50_01605 [Methanosarcinaceae archaeon]|nr:hypothetical protein [Methanosarcinaceae archaeon]HJH30901.1 hypothetical protein [Methanosarcinaceae archaeon]